MKTEQQQQQQYLFIYKNKVTKMGIIRGNFAFQNGMGLTIKTANPVSPCAYTREGLLSEEYLRLRFGALIFVRVYFWRG